MQQFGNLGHVRNVGRRAMDMVHQARFHVGTDVRLHPEEVLIAFLGLVHFGGALAVLVLRRAGSMDNRGIHNGALTQRQTLVLQIARWLAIL